jgi:molybdopterin-guanine dinucleotide biosynthesis protein A
MGRDKAFLPLPGRSGETLAQSVARAVMEAAGNATLVGDPERYGPLGHPVIPDLYPGEGPLGGILTVLEHTAADWNLVAACDMPGLTADFLRKLLETARAQEADILLPVGPVGKPEVLCAVYRKRALEGLAAAFQEGVRKVAWAVAKASGLRTVFFKFAEVSVFQNVNTPEEWAAHGAD